MRKHYKDTDYLHATARVRALENGMVMAADFRKMVEARNAEEAYKVLADAPLCQGFAIEDYDKALDNSLAEAYALVEKLSPEPEIVTVFRAKYDGHNLKVAIKARLLNSEVDGSYIPLGSVPVKNVAEELQNGAASFPEPLAEAARAATEALAKTGDPQAVDILMDRAVLGFMLQKAEEVGNPFLTGFVTAQVDIANIRTAVRLQRMGKDAAALGRVLVTGGSIPVEDLEAAGLKGIEELLQRVSSWEYGRMLEPSFDLLRAGGSLTLFEKLCDNVLVSLLDRTRLIPFGIEPLVTYLYAKECEVKAARIVMASKLAGVAPQQITERLRETYG